MNTPPEDDFLALRRLLALKRHEQPPPGYFDDLSANVLASLRASRKTRRSAEETDSVPGWLVNLLERLQAHPAFATLVGASLCCVVLIGGIFVYDNASRTPAPMPSLLSEITPARPPEPAVAGSANALQPVTADPLAPLIASSNLPVATGSSLFNAVPGLETAPVGYR